jgi:hypothetical protein
VAPDRAVEWSKPADWEYDPETGVAGLGTPRGTFLAALLDGSVHRLSLGIGDKTLKALVTKAGEEIVDDWNNVAPAPQLFKSGDEPASDAVGAAEAEPVGAQ